MTLQEYKQSWMNSCFSVRISKNLRSRAKDWCVTRLHPNEWEFAGEVDSDVDIFHFEKQYHSQQFAQEFFSWLRK